MHSPLRSLTLVLAVALAAPAGADSLFKPTSAGPGWFADLKARRVGDLVTILINEESKATTDQSQSHSSGVDVSGAITKLQNILGLVKPDPDNPDHTTPVKAGLPEVEWKAARKRDASAKNESEESLELRVSAVVKEVLPNGNLLVEATREIRHGRDLRLIHISGIVRPADISAENTVQSENIAQARVSYVGRGPVSRVSNKGFFSHVVDFVWPF